MKPGAANFDEIYATYHPRIHRYLGRLLGPDEAQDVAQEVFAKVGRGLDGFRGESQLSTWIYRIAHRAAVDRFRAGGGRARRATEPLPPDDRLEGLALGDPGSEAAGIDERLARDEARVCIRRYIDALPEPYRAVFVLADLEDLGNDEIAEILGLSLATVKIRLHRARAKLREMLATHCVLSRDERNELACEPRPGGTGAPDDGA